MWLLNVQTRQLEEFIGIEVPAYAILSHTWESGQEVTFQELPSRGNAKRGWWKIDQTCRQAERDRLHYVWIDTCCIDKSSSAELSESINSMFNWYQSASVCYVYFEDLLRPSSAAATRGCRWYTRAWTLQELIAPRHIKFYSRDWDFCFTKDDETEELSRITGIASAVLRHEIALTRICAAQKMSWAQSRKATRAEDIAYSLLGLFDINMPLLYGEGPKAFTRLQSEIIKSSPDISILAWADTPIPSRDKMPDKEAPDKVLTVVLASSPDRFAGCQDFSILPFRWIAKFSVSAFGLDIIRAKVWRGRFGPWYGFFLPVCQRMDGILCIKLRNLGDRLFVREDPTALVSVQSLKNPATYTLAPTLLTQPTPFLPAGTRWGQSLLAAQRQSALQIVTTKGIYIYRQWPWTQWDEKDLLFFAPDGLNSGWVALQIECRPSSEFMRPPVHLRFLLYVFGWAQKGSATPPRLTIHKFETPGVRALEDINDKAVDSEWTARHFCSRLRERGVPERSSAVVGSSNGRTMLLTCDLRIVEDTQICTHPFWQLRLHFDVKQSNQVGKIKDQCWEGMKWEEDW